VYTLRNGRSHASSLRLALKTSLSEPRSTNRLTDAGVSPSMPILRSFTWMSRPVSSVNVTPEPKGKGSL
jgi:hypothetical protein